MAMFRTAEEMTDIVAFWGSSFPHPNVLPKPLFLLAFVQTQERADLWQQRMKEERKIGYFSTFSFQVFD